ANGPLQDGLVKEMRLRGIDTVAAGNAFLPTFMAGYNARFAKPPFDERDLHRPLAGDDDLDDAFAWKEDRTVSKNLTLQYDQVLFVLEPMADLRSGTMAWTSLMKPSTSGRRSIRLPSSRTSALVRCLPTSPRSRRSWTCRGRPRHRGDVASAITCSRSDSAEQGPSTPKPGEAATLHPKTVTFVTGAKSDFSKWL